MLEKFRKFIPSLLNKIKIGLNNMPKPLKYITLGYIFLVAIVLILYISCWVYLFYLGKVALTELLAFLQVIVGNSMIAFVTFILGLFIDTNDNNVPDVLEKEK